MGQASQLFNGNADQTLIGRITPTSEQREFLQKHWNDLAEQLKKTLGPRYGYPVSTWLQGSYKYATLIKPVHAHEEYDVDLGVYFEWGDEEDIEPTPKQLRDWVQAEMLEYAKLCDDLESVEVPAKERCSRASYVRQFHIDTPVYHLNPNSDVRRLACWSDKWEHSDPKAIYKWFRDAVSGDRAQLRRLVRYLKAWAAVSFDDAADSRPSSIFLTVVGTESYQALRTQRLLGIDDDDALVAVIKKMHDRLFDERKVANPVDESEDLNRMSADGWDGFLTRLSSLQDIAERADEADDEASAALIWSEAFSFLMPLPEADQVEMVDESSGRAVMQLPEIDIEVFTGDPARSVARYRNEVPSVAKECSLVFSIVNPHVVPEFATVEWTVRNEGQEADARSDMGHRRVGMRLLTNDEHTAYAGRHFMDCIVRLNGQVYAVRRVPVAIRDVQRLPQAQRNPPKPSYTKLKSHFRRRR